MGCDIVPLLDHAPNRSGLASDPDLHFLFANDPIIALISIVKICQDGFEELI
jgi:hypothetical protein